MARQYSAVVFIDSAELEPATASVYSAQLKNTRLFSGGTDYGASEMSGEALTKEEKSPPVPSLTASAHFCFSNQWYAPALF